MLIFAKKRMTEQEFQKKLTNIKNDNIQKEYRKSLKNERNKYKDTPKIETNKIIALYLFTLLNTIIIYSMIAMWRFSDLSYLGVLISDIAAQVIVYAIYCMKAYHGKKQEEDMKFKREQTNGFDDIEYDCNADDSDEIAG